MRRIAIINQKGGVGKTTTTANLGAALALGGRRVALIDLDPQGNLSLHLDLAVPPGEPSTYTVLSNETSLAAALRPTKTPGLALVPSNIDLSGAELELASAIGRESILRDAIDAWEKEAREKDGRAPADYVLIDCPPSLGLLSINGLVASGETIITLQTEFFALQGMSKLVEVLQLLRRRLNPALKIAGILPCMYDTRLKLAREVLSEIKRYFPGEVFARAIGKNVKLAEAPSYGQTIFEYAPECSGAADYRAVAEELCAQESGDLELAALPRPAAFEAAPRAARAPKAERREEPAPAPEPPGAVEAAATAAPSFVELREVVLVPQRAPEVAPAEQEPQPQPEHQPARQNGAAHAEPAVAVVAIAAAHAEEPALEDVAGPFAVAPELEELPPLPDDAILLSAEEA